MAAIPRCQESHQDHYCHDRNTRVILSLIRDDDPENKHNLGKLFIDGKYLGETLEDTDRRLEAGGEKAQNETCIPRGRYPVTLSKSLRFGKVMPEVHDVPGFTGVRIHGGNSEVDTSGCPLLGQYRTETGVGNCSGVNQRLIHLLEAADTRNEKCWLEVT